MFTVTTIAASPWYPRGVLEGLITTQALNEVPRREWAEHTVGEVMLTDLRALSIAPIPDAHAGPWQNAADRIEYAPRY